MGTACACMLFYAQLSPGQHPVYPLWDSHIRESWPSLSPSRAHKSRREGQC